MAKPKRTSAQRNVIPTILIVTEGIKTEVNYFNSFDVATLTCEVVIEGAGRCTSAVVNYAIKMGKQGEFDQIWCVFDYDEFDDFDNAIYSARTKGIHVAYSNECFEYWLLLHFEYLTSSIPRKDYAEKLSAYLGYKYDKVSKDIFKFFEDKQDIAIKYAKKVEQSHDELNPNSPPSKRNPSTRVYELVEILNQYKKK